MTFKFTSRPVFYEDTLRLQRENAELRKMLAEAISSATFGVEALRKLNELRDAVRPVVFSKTITVEDARRIALVYHQLFPETSSDQYSSS